MGKYRMTKEQFVSAMLQDIALKKELNEIQSERKAIISSKKTVKSKTETKKVDTPKTETKKVNTHKTKTKTADTSNSKDRKSIIMTKIQEILLTQEFAASIDKNVIMVAHKNENYELKCTHKNAPYEVETFKATRSMTKNSLIKIITSEFLLEGFNCQAIDKSGIIGIDNGNDYYTVKITKKGS